MMKTNAKRKNSAIKKLVPAAGMLALSASMLATSTYAWFTMNKSVEVTGMKLKAQAEKGILINEMAGNGTVGEGNSAVDNGTWSESALAESTVNALRPASTANFTAWWHANSKKTNTEAGVNAGGNGVDNNTVQLTGGGYYSNITYVENGATVLKHDTAATADTNCASTVYYTDGTGANTGYDDGEGFYVKYTYYIKSSSNDGLTVSTGNLQATVTAALQGNGAAQDLDKALRVGVKVAGDTKATVFAPVANSTTTAYKVTGDTAGTANSLVEVTPIAGGTATSINAAAVDLPKVTEDGLAVDVYVWFEGEDANCMSDNLAATLNAYQIDITFTDADLA
jgi:hypothetical protein